MVYPRPSRGSRSSHGSVNRRQSVPAGRTTIIRNPNLPRNVRSHERVEVVPNRYYWHRNGRHRYGHYYSYGVHWYGFYDGPSFYWARYHNNYWWRYDARFSRWVYWYGGHWWWPAPAGGVYVAIDNEYYPYQSGYGPAVEPPPSGVALSGGSWKSPDGERMVEISGNLAEAFLYDTSGKAPAFLKRLGQSVENVRFSGGENGKPLQILIEFSDDRFEIFDESGNSFQPVGQMEPPPPVTDLPGNEPPPDAQ